MKYSFIIGVYPKKKNRTNSVKYLLFLKIKYDLQQQSMLAIGTCVDALL